MRWWRRLLYGPLPNPQTPLEEEILRTIHKLGELWDRLPPGEVKAEIARLEMSLYGELEKTLDARRAGSST